MTLALAPEWKQSILSGDIVIPKESIELSFSLESSLLGKETEQIEIQLQQESIEEHTSNFNANITVSASEQSETVELAEPTIKVESISYGGLLTIAFSDPFVVIEDLSLLKVPLYQSDSNSI